MSQSNPPPGLTQDHPTATLLRHEIWDRLHSDNEHYIAGVFGREGKGKSGTALSIAELVDYRMCAEQVMFDPGKLLQRIDYWKEEGTTQGRMIVVDEAGVGLGNRSWYEKDQILFAQVLQLIRSENMGILFTVPRGTEMDSQVRGGRLHSQLLVNKKNEGEYVELEYERVRVSRRIDSDNVWTPKPEMKIENVERTVEGIKIPPPSDWLWKNYQKRKNEFQSEQYQDAAEEMTEDQEEQVNKIKQIANDIEDGKLPLVVSEDGRSGDPYIDKDLIRAEFDTSQADSNAVKSLLEKRLGSEDLENNV